MGDFIYISKTVTDSRSPILNPQSLILVALLSKTKTNTDTDIDADTDTDSRWLWIKMFFIVDQLH